jgi:hypothetical protein
MVVERRRKKRGRTSPSKISDSNISVRLRKKVACKPTPVSADRLSVPVDQMDRIHIRFPRYPPTDFAVWGRVLSELVSFDARVMKRYSDDRLKSGTAHTGRTHWQYFARAV